MTTHRAAGDRGFPHGPDPLAWAARAADEFVLTTVLLFLVVTVIRWLRDPVSFLYIADLDAALVVIGLLSGTIVIGLMFTAPGRRSGAQMNPAVTVALWLLAALPGRSVAPYVLAQLAGSAAGTGLGRLAWGRAVSSPAVAYVAIRPSATWPATAVFLAEAGCMFALILGVGFILTHARFHRLLPYVIGLSVALVIAFLGSRSGGSINPARQFGPAALSGQTTDLWIYLSAPVLGAALGATVHNLLNRKRSNTMGTKLAYATSLLAAGGVALAIVAAPTAAARPTSCTAIDASSACHLPGYRAIAESLPPVGLYRYGTTPSVVGGH